MHIQRLLKYHFLNREKRRYLVKYGYTNGCGGKGGINFSDIMEREIKNLKGFNIKYLLKLKQDLELLCIEHDIDFFLGGTMIDFFKANLQFSYKVFKLLKWTKINNLFGRIIIFLIMLYLLNKYGKDYFSFGKKKTIEELFINFTSNKNYY